MSQLPADPTFQPTQDTGTIVSLGGLELRLDSGLCTQNLEFLFQGKLTGTGAEHFCAGGSLQIQNAATGLVEEAFFVPEGRFTQVLTVAPEADSRFVLFLCDAAGNAKATAPIAVRHQALKSPLAPRDSGVPVLPQALAIAVRDRGGKPHLHLLAPAGASLPGRFACQCRTSDQCGRVVVPLWEDSRLVHELVVGELDAQMPAGIPVDVELHVQADRAMTLRVLVRQAGRGETVQLPAPPAPRRPTLEEIDVAFRRIAELLPGFTGKYGAQLAHSYRQQHHTLQAALDSGDDLHASAAFSALEEQLVQMELARFQVGYPPRQRLTQQVKKCLFEAANLADLTGRDRQQLFDQVYAQELAAEEARDEKNATLYRECFDHLHNLAMELHRQHVEMLPPSRREPDRGPGVHDVLDELKDLEAYLAAVVPAAQFFGKQDILERLQALDGLRPGLADRAKRDPRAASRDARRALADIAGVEQALTGGRTRLSAAEGMVEAFA